MFEKISNVVYCNRSFLKAKGWELEQKTDTFDVFNPPKQFEFESKFQFKIPFNETGTDYLEYSSILIGSMAVLCQTKKRILMDLFCLTLEEIKVDMEYWEAILTVGLDRENGLFFLERKPVVDGVRLLDFLFYSLFSSPNTDL